MFSVSDNLVTGNALPLAYRCLSSCCILIPPFLNTRTKERQGEEEGEGEAEREMVGGRSISSLVTFLLRTLILSVWGPFLMSSFNLN